MMIGIIVFYIKNSENQPKIVENLHKKLETNKLLSW